MKKTLFAGFLLLCLLATGIQIAAISDSKNTAASAAVKKVNKTSTPRDMVYYRNIFFANKEGC